MANKPTGITSSDVGSCMVVFRDINKDPLGPSPPKEEKNDYKKKTGFLQAVWILSAPVDGKGLPQTPNRC